MQILQDSFTLGFTATAVLVIRLLMTPLVIYNMAWSFKSFISFMKGCSSPIFLFESIIFLMSSGLLGVHLMAFAGRTSSSWSEPYTLMLLCFFFLASMIAAVAHKAAITLKFERFYWLFRSNHLDIAVRAAQMNELDSAYTQRAIENAETGLAIHLAKKVTHE